ncbi:MAG: glutaredoxin family protein [Proteobacteria bacterium]|nr:glutaredoxin family protein [Pseudomonadota bacterium]
MTDNAEFVLYTRSTCSLCDAMEDELRPFITEYSITVRRQYIDNDAALEKLYGSRVPVLSLNDETVCEYFLEPETLRSLLKGL